MSDDDVIEVRSVQVGRPSVLGTTAAGDEVTSAIVKAAGRPARPTLTLSTINLEGDDQADRTVHGGPDKAVYAYSADHFERWSDGARPRGRSRLVRREPHRRRGHRARRLHR